MEPGKVTWRLSTNRKLSSSVTSCMIYQRPPPHVLNTIRRSKSTSNSTLSTMAKVDDNKAAAEADKTVKKILTVEEELRRRREKKAEKDRIAKLKREYKAELSKTKRAKYSTASLSAHGVLRDLKNSASRGVSTMKNSFENLLTQKLKFTSSKEGTSNWNQVNYTEFENDEPRTPVKLYSPFGIESPHVSGQPNGPSSKTFGKSNTPVMKKRGIRLLDRNRIQPSQSSSSMMMFASPTGRIKDDVRSITNSLNELSMISQDIQYKFTIPESSSCFSISTQ
ncbi:hypothetical protein HDE_11617 [Halotydeus destructor]|nr:hypothetical protein HDE_11617 [Halotydeus destructor]